METYKDINLTQYNGEDYTGLYQISNSGKIKSLAGKKQSYKITKEKILKYREGYKNYLKICLYKNKKTKKLFYK